MKLKILKLLFLLVALFSLLTPTFLVIAFQASNTNVKYSLNEKILHIKDILLRLTPIQIFQG